MTSLNLFHTDHAVRFPLPAKPDVVSHPVSASKAGNASHLTLPNCRTMRVASRYRDVFPVPNDTINCSHASLLVVLTARTTTSVSTVLTKILLNPCLAPSAACSSIRVSASLCVQGESPCSLTTSEQRSSFPLVITTTPGKVSAVRGGHGDLRCCGVACFFVRCCGE